MSRMRVLILVIFTSVVATAFGMAISQKAVAQETPKADKNLEKVLWDADQKWLCSTGAGPYHKAFKDCVEFRRTFWTDQFFEVSTNGQVRTKAQIIEAQSKTNFATAEPDPTDFKLMAVYGNFALATDLTLVKMRDTSGEVISTTDTRVLRMFVKENGNWRPAGAALVPIVSNQPLFLAKISSAPNVAGHSPFATA